MLLTLHCEVVLLTLHFGNANLKTKDTNITHHITLSVIRLVHIRGVALQGH